MVTTRMRRSWIRSQNVGAGVSAAHAYVVWTRVITHRGDPVVAGHLTFIASFDQHGRDHQLRHSHRSTLVVGCKRCPETAVNDVVNSHTLSSTREKPLCAYVQAGLVVCGGRLTILRCPNSVLLLAARTPLTRRAATPAGPPRIT